MLFGATPFLACPLSSWITNKPIQILYLLSERHGHAPKRRQLRATYQIMNIHGGMVRAAAESARQLAHLLDASVELGQQQPVECRSLRGGRREAARQPMQRAKMFGAPVADNRQAPLQHGPLHYTHVQGRRLQ